MIEPTRALAAMALRWFAVEKASPQPNKKSEGSPRWEARRRTKRRLKKLISNIEYCALPSGIGHTRGFESVDGAI
jgi:hypothetical protein